MTGGAAHERRRAAGLLAAATFVVGASVGAIALSLPYPLEREVWLARASGWMALVALAGALCVTPLSGPLEALGLPAARRHATRRALGVTSAWLALLHAAVALSTYLSWNWAVVIRRPHLRAGLVAAAVLALLLATSYPRVVRALRMTTWKELHRLAYVAALLTALHVLQSPFADRALSLVFFGGLLAVGLGRLLGRRRIRGTDRSARDPRGTPRP